MNSSLTPQDLDFYATQGYLLKENFFPKDFIDNIVYEIEDFLKNSKIEIKFRDSYLPNSADSTFRFAQNQNEIDADGKPLDFGFEKYFNFLGNNLKYFDEMVFSEEIKNVLKDIGYRHPRIGFIDYLIRTPLKTKEYDQAHIENDHIFTDPPYTSVLWITFDDVSESEGCLWVEPEGHKKTYETTQIIRDNGKVKYRNKIGELSEKRKSNLQFSTKTFKPLKATKGSLVVMNGFTPHIGDFNQSGKRKRRLSIAVVENSNTYPSENYIENNAAKPFPIFY